MTRQWMAGAGLAAGMCAAAFAPIAAGTGAARGDPAPVAWDDAARAAFYRLDQGSRLIPLAWIRALQTEDGRAFADRLARYGFLADPFRPSGLPIGLSTSDTPTGAVVGMTCAACHTRQITTGGRPLLIDGGPAFIDFQSFITDLDAAVIAVLADAPRFAHFADAVLGPAAADPTRVAALRAEVTLWSSRMHALVGGSMEAAHPWGAARLDAMQLIFNELAGLDVGAPPSFILAANMAKGSAPVRYPFLWNAARQDHVQWGGFSKNGNDVLALTRNLGQLYGVFGTFSPRPIEGGRWDYLTENSANMRGLVEAEALIRRIQPPAWPGAIDRALAEAGHRVFDRAPDQGGCAACHEEQPGVVRQPGETTWLTPRLDVGTDTSVWDNVLLRTVATGSMEGAGVPGYFPPLKAKDSALSLLEIAVLGSIFQDQARASGGAPMMAAMPTDGPTDMPKREMVETPPADPRDAFKAYVYEARVLHGIWAAAPYLHNGSVPTLAALLMPPADRPARFAIGPAYDLDRVGLAAMQPAGTFELSTTGCEARGSGVSRCGHEFGTRLPAADKRALLEYLKTF